MFDVDKMYIMYPEFDVKHSYNIEQAWKDFYSENTDIVEEIDQNYTKLLNKYIEEQTEGWDAVETEDVEEFEQEFKNWMKSNGIKKYSYSTTARQRFTEWFKDKKDTYLEKTYIKKKQLKFPEITTNEDGSIEDTEFNKIIDSLVLDETLTPFQEKELKGKRNNMIIDMMRSILTHENTASKILNPGGFALQKRAARIVTILQQGGEQLLDAAKNAGFVVNGKVDVYEYLNSFIDEELDSMAKKYAPKMDITNSITQVILHQANTIAGRLIGIFANHNAHHAIMQQTQLSISPNFSFKLNGKIASSLHNIFAFDGSNISRNLSGFLAAAVDAVKDPVLKFLNLNDFTADICGLLTRAGYSPDTVGLLLNQPIILDITKEYFKGVKQGVNKKTAIENVMARYYTNSSEITELDDNISFFNRDLAKAISLGNRAKNAIEVNDALIAYNDYQIQVAHLFLKLQMPSTVLADAVASSRADTSGGGTGPTHADTINKLNRTSDYLKDIDKEKPVLLGGHFLYEGVSTQGTKKGLFKRLLDKELPINQTFFTLGLEATKEIMSKYFPHFKPEFMYVIDKLRSYTTYNKLDEKTMNSVFSDLFTYILTQNVEFGNGNNATITEEATRFINDFPQEFEAILDANPEFRKNGFIKYINPTSEDGIASLKFRQVGKLSAIDRDNVMMAWESLLYSSAEGKELAINLFKYAYYRNGFSFGPSSWMHLAPVEVKKAIPGYIDDLNKILDRTYDEKVYEAFIGQYLVNHSDNRKLVPLITDENSDIEYLDETGQPLPYIMVEVTNSSPKDNLKALVKKGTKTETINGYKMEFPWNSWKPVISFQLANGSTVLYAADLEEDPKTGELKAMETVQYKKIEKAAVEKLFLHYVYGQDFREFTNVLRAPVVPNDIVDNNNVEDQIESDAELTLGNEDVIGTVFASITGINSDDLKSNEDFNPNKNSELYNEDGTRVCNGSGK